MVEKAVCMDLDIKRVLQARPDAPQDSELVPLTTVWGSELNSHNVLAEHPRPQFERSQWRSLNGTWQYAIRECANAEIMWSQASAPDSWDGKILVPFSPEAPLSGVGRKLQPNQLLWYRRDVRMARPRSHRRLLLHFEAVDYACAIYVNGVQVTTHVGGYLPIDADITEAARTGANTIAVCVYDPSETGTQLRGKQRLVRGNMWYTAQSGIWQSVWLEEVPARRVDSLQIKPDADAGMLEIRANLSEPGGKLAAEVVDARGAVVARTSVLVARTSRLSARTTDPAAGSAEQPAHAGKARTNEPAAGANDPTARYAATLQLSVEAPHLWEPDDPYLYALRVTYADDEVRSYCAFRTVGVELDDKGVPRFCLNHRPFFVRGVLDQGYWPDGMMTAPADEAFVADIRAMRDAGFNMLRKHIKIESERYYWHCDRLGMLVWQDMVSGGDLPGEWPSVNIPTLVRRSWTTLGDKTERAWRRYGAGDPSYRAEWLETARAAIQKLANHPCVATWVVFNESWGQFASEKVTEELRQIDPTRPFIATSGWYDQGAGDYFAVHNYFRSMRVYRDPNAGPLRRRTSRAFIIDEFGGLTCPVEGHVSVPNITYGYDAFEDLGEWRKAFRALLAEVDALESQGLAGFVYTQVSDVEEETNGIVTYDRRVNKLNA